jgi:CheY-like chemotaxis protein
MTLSAPILVLDDDDDVRDMLCMLLAAEGYRCMGFAAGADALARMREDERPALVVLDLMMPGMDGEAVVRHMTEDPSLTAIPIAVASGHANAREVEWARPISACLIKPIELDELISVVAQFARPMR